MNHFNPCRCSVWILLAACLFCRAGHGYTQVGLPLRELPQEHQYQRDLRSFLAGFGC